MSKWLISISFVLSSVFGIWCLIYFLNRGKSNESSKALLNEKNVIGIMYEAPVNYVCSIDTSFFLNFNKKSNLKDVYTYLRARDKNNSFNFVSFTFEPRNSFNVESYRTGIKNLIGQAKFETQGYRIDYDTRKVIIDGILFNELIAYFNHDDFRKSFEEHFIFSIYDQFVFLVSLNCNNECDTLISTIKEAKISSNSILRTQMH